MLVTPRGGIHFAPLLHASFWFDLGAVQIISKHPFAPLLSTYSKENFGIYILSFEYILRVKQHLGAVAVPTNS